MKITYYGHSCLGIETQGFHLLIDPFIRPNPKAAHFDVDSIKADFMLITHAHYDHILDVDYFAEKNQSTIIANHEISVYYEKLGFKIHGMNHGGSFTFPFGKLKMVNAVHSSSFPDSSYGGNPCGFVLESEGKTVYIAGDTALTADMKLIPMFFELDIAVLPIGGNFTMDVEEAVVAADFIKCSRILGVHYDTVEVISIDHDLAKKAFSKNNKELLLLEIGDSFSV